MRPPAHHPQPGRALTGRAMWHTIFIAAHAATAGVALLAGCTTIARGTLFGTYLWSLVAMEAFLVLAIAAEWSAIDAATRGLFVAFAALGLFMVWRADQARRTQPSRSSGPSASFVAHVGFTLVALFDAFVVILVLDLGAPTSLLDNFEALELGPRLRGGRRALLLVSDDNFNDVQVTRVVALAARLHPPAKAERRPKEESRDTRPRGRHER